MNFGVEVERGDRRKLADRWTDGQTDKLNGTQTFNGRDRDRDWAEVEMTWAEGKRNEGQTRSNMRERECVWVYVCEREVED